MNNINIQIEGDYHEHNPNLMTLLYYLIDMRKEIYTTNVIGSLNSIVHHPMNKEKFSSDDLVKHYLTGICLP